MEPHLRPSCNLLLHNEFQCVTNVAYWENDPARRRLHFGRDSGAFKLVSNDLSSAQCVKDGHLPRSSDND